MGRRLVMDRGHIIRLSLIPEFYRRFPQFADLQETAETAWRTYETTNPNCNQCGKEWKFMRGTVDAMINRLGEHQNDAEFKTRFKTMIKERLGYWPDPIVIYYRRSSRSKLKTLKL